MEKRYCSACGAEEVDGICSSGRCPRRKIQLRQQAAREAAEKATGKSKAE